MLNAMAPPVRSRSGRPEFGRVYLRSLIASAEEQVDLHRAGGHRLRLWLATRRLRRLLAYENRRHDRIGAAAVREPPRVAVAAVSAALVALLVVLGILELQGAGAFWLTAAELPMLALALLWFFLAVRCVANDLPSPEQVTTDER
jgi:hypothetical protein